MKSNDEQVSGALIFAVGLGIVATVKWIMK